MKNSTISSLLVLAVIIMGCSMHVYSQDAPPGYRVARNYHESFAEADASFSATTLPAGWVRLEDKVGNISYSTTRDNGGHAGKAIGHTKSQSNVRSGSTTIELRDYLISP